MKQVSDKQAFKNRELARIKKALIERYGDRCNNPIYTCNYKYKAMKEDYIERAVIKLHRKYTKDELIQHLNKQLSEKDS